MSDLLDRIALAFEHFDLSMDGILDEEHDASTQAAISTGLAIRLAAYATGAQSKEAEMVALSLVRELTTMKRMLKNAHPPVA